MVVIGEELTRLSSDQTGAGSSFFHPADTLHLPLALCHFMKILLSFKLGWEEFSCELLAESKSEVRRTTSWSINLSFPIGLIGSDLG